jgi:hypothetical protein
MMRVLCFLGLHSFYWHATMLENVRVCKRCERTWSRLFQKPPMVVRLKRAWQALYGDVWR